MRKIRYEYDIVSGLNQKKVLGRETTRESARAFKRELDTAQPQVTHRIIQRRYDLLEAREVR